MSNESPDFETIGTASRRLGLAPETVRRLADAGRLPTLRTPLGVRLFRRADVDAYRAARHGRRGDPLEVQS
jgi:excisionase family DNA binding protein